MRPIELRKALLACVAVALLTGQVPLAFGQCNRYGPPLPPTNVTTDQAVCASWIRVVWRPPPQDGTHDWADTYELYRNGKRITPPGFTGLAVDDNGADLSGGLVRGTRYNYVVVARNCRGSSTGTPPLQGWLAANLSMPATLTVTDENNQVRLTWSGVADADYHLYVDGDLLINLMRPNPATAAPTTYLVPICGTHEFCVSAFNCYGVSTQKCTSHTAPPPLGPPGVPVLVSATPGPIACQTNVALDWNPANGACEYEVQVATDPSFPPYPWSSITSSTKTDATFPGAVAGTTYYWRVQATNPNGTLGWSAIATFTPAVPVPGLSSPNDGTTVAGPGVTLSWTACSGLSSHLEIATNSSFTSPVVSISLTETSYPWPCALTSTTYYWRVRVCNGGTCSNNSAYRTFTVSSPPAGPILVSPQDGEFIPGPDVALSWEPTCSSNSYHVQIANNAAFNSPIVDTPVGGTNYLWTAAPVGTYYWRVRWCGSNCSLYSPHRTFRNLPPVADFSGSPTSGAAPLTVQFTDLSTNSPTSWLWDFGDGNSSTQENPVHQYTNDGDYTVSLTASNHWGSNTTTKTGYITQAFEWTLDWLPGPLVEVESVSFAYGSSGTGYIVYRDGTLGLKCGRRLSPCSWTFEPIDASPTYQSYARTSVATGPQGVVGVAYAKDKPGGAPGFELWYAWSQYPGTWYRVRVSTTLSDPAQLSTKIDANGYAHIAYLVNTDAFNRSLYYATVSPGPSLVVTTPETVWGLIPTGSGNSVSIALSAQGVPAIAATGFNYFYRQGASWIRDTGVTIGDGCSLALDAAGNPRISQASGSLLYAWRESNGTWHIDNLGSGVGLPSTSLQLNAAGLGRIAAIANGQLRYYREVAPGSWASSPSNSSVCSGSELGLALNASGYPVIGYSNANGGNCATGGFLGVTEASPGNADATPPSAVTDLAVYTGVHTAIVSWTATGDNGSVGTADHYDLRYATAPITNESDFNIATPVNTGCPLEAGWGECASQANLAGCNRYYFRLKVRDNAGNWSPLSNSASGITRCSGQEVWCDSGFKPEPGEDLPQVTSISGVRPNPTSGSVNVEVALAPTEVDQPIDLMVYDVAGRRVATLRHAHLGVGRHVVSWDARGTTGQPVAAGIYFVRLQVGAKSMTQRFVVMR